MPDMIDRRSLVRLVVGGVSLGAFPLAGAGSAFSNAFPNRNIMIIVPFQPGGSNDIIARLVSPLLSSELKTNVIIENKPGASGIIGSAHVAKSEADGHTILIAPVGVLSVNQWMFKDLSYNPEKDFAPLSLAATVSNVLVVNPSFPAKSVQELVAYAKANPGKVNFASMGIGTSGHLCGEMFKKAAGVDITHVPYKGSAPATSDLLAGQVQMMFDNLPTSLPHIQSGGLRALAVTSADRHPQAPDVPTVKESGYSDFVAESWFGFVAPAKTPENVRNTLASSLAKALQNDNIRAQLEKMGLRVSGNTPAQFASYIASESQKWKKVIDDAGVGIKG